MGQIQITSQKATLSIQTQRANLNLHSAPARMRVNRNTPARVKITSEIPKFHVNWKKVRAESGLKAPDIMAREWADESRQANLENIAFIVNQGDFLMDFKNTSIGMAAENEMPIEIPEINIGLMPQSPPEITWEDSKFDMEWTEADLDISWDKGGVEMNFQPHSVEIKIKDFPEVRISYHGGNPNGVGNKVDNHI